jgi:exosortase family protein XrtF
MNFKEFKPTIYFLIKFLGFYLAGNLLYGLYVTNFEPAPDPITTAVTKQTALVLDQLGWSTEVIPQIIRPTVTIMHQQKAIVAVYEGCNGINVMIIFLAFVVAFGPIRKSMIWFVLAGLIIIHISNLVRIGLLFLVALYKPHYLYFSHKYFFTAFIYGFVLVLWMIWVKYFSRKKSHAQH